MDYKVTHYHQKAFGFALDEIPVPATDPRWCTEYTVSAGSPFEAAVLAHGLYNGYKLDELEPDSSSSARTVRERLEDSIHASGKNNAGEYVYHYDNISGHWITVSEI